MVTQLVNETVFEGLVNSVLLSVIIALLIFIAKAKNSEFQKDKNPGVKSWNTRT